LKEDVLKKLLAGTATAIALLVTLPSTAHAVATVSFSERAGPSPHMTVMVDNPDPAPSLTISIDRPEFLPAVQVTVRVVDGCPSDSSTLQCDGDSR
jgi:hypothetical protein